VPAVRSRLVQARGCPAGSLPKLQTAELGHAFAGCGASAQGGSARNRITPEKSFGFQAHSQARCSSSARDGLTAKEEREGHRMKISGTFFAPAEGRLSPLVLK
jgi:hypothetical protein